MTRRLGILRIAPAILSMVLLGACSSLSSPDVEPGSPLLLDVPYSAVLELEVAPESASLAYGDDPLQFALRWDARGRSRGVVVFVHGGCWLSAFDLEHVRAATTALAEAGYETWSVEYRRHGDPGGGWPSSLEDVVEAARAIAANSSSRPIVLAGHSAGGHLALLAAGRLGAKIDGVVGLAAITDVVAYAGGSNSCQQATEGFMGGSFEERPESYQAANVAGQSLHPRAILLQGDADAIVEVGQAEVDGAETRLLEGVGHFDWVHPGSEAFRVFLDTLGSLSR